MVCIYCGGQTQVTNSREQKRVGNVWRRRECKTCHALFTSIESADLASSLMVNYPATHRLEHFSRDKLFMSLVRALGHRNDAVQAAGALTATSIAHLLKARPGASIEVSDIRRHAHAVLARFDKIAAISYAAYHTV